MGCLTLSQKLGRNTVRKPEEGRDGHKSSVSFRRKQDTIHTSDDRNRSCYPQLLSGSPGMRVVQMNSVWP